MNQLIEKLTGMAPLTDQIIATDILVRAKAEIKNYALAITETATQEIRNLLTQQLDEAIDFHEQISNYMISKNFYNPYDTNKQLQMDLKNAEAVLKLTQGK
ncbi:spore coat protein [Terrilactibacillus sp. BCM23-1]|uniref:Spore coat protein n=1 Tax=Terrilactibacillus tamarindi TaxID=2599694 RepID=A0A6N8CQS8_9BACI|nr:spore coat protein [Terrilactibacillus tamarindi]MTT32391.1 spore coat protein [Terrilactibacillus tamarindi]